MGKGGDLEAYSKRGIHKYVTNYIGSLPDLSGKTVLDIPCGDGRTSYAFLKKNAKVISLDLFPEFLKSDKLTAEFGDLTETLPLEDGSVDYIMCQEGIEHIPDKLFVLREFNRVLKKDGVLLITTPSLSHLRARFSYFLIESNLWKRMPPTELDSIWFAEDNKKPYFGHLFLTGAQHLETLLTITGFMTKKRVKTDICYTSCLLAFVFIPVVLIFTLISYFLYINKNKNVDYIKRKSILFNRARLNISLKTLLYKHFFWVAKKTDDLETVFTNLRSMQRS